MPRTIIEVKRDADKTWSVIIDGLTTRRGISKADAVYEARYQARGLRALGEVVLHIQTASAGTNPLYYRAKTEVYR